ncbi:hypothetical protein AB0M46_15995 [Dactylosporangium sp. NPDC051485]|uniref:hypothetical protein n=1 Tax=Dactylosporangium sp. NPDC051485 TaxID=3154846 RepID=UPI00341D4109
MYLRRALLAIATVIASVLAVGLAPTGAMAASWSGRCYDGLANSWKVSLPGKSDLDINAMPCVYISGNQLYASVILDWINDQAPPVGSGHKFDGFIVRANFEVRPNGSSTDTIFTHTDCNITSTINSKWSGIYTCKTPVYTGYSSAFDYSGDGWAQWDVDNDGKGWLTPRQFVGSPLLY